MAANSYIGRKHKSNNEIWRLFANVNFKCFFRIHLAEFLEDYNCLKKFQLWFTEKFFLILDSSLIYYFIHVCSGQLFSKRLKKYTSLACLSFSIDCSFINLFRVWINLCLKFGNFLALSLRSSTSFGKENTYLHWGMWKFKQYYCIPLLEQSLMNLHCLRGIK